jgi:ubiquinone/menaquinone biosynthesis C-methylase UbiE
MFEPLSNPANSRKSRRGAREIARNVRIHDRIARKYEALHGEIFNGVEQSRLRGWLERAAAEVRTGSKPISALDVGCGSGNLTRHLLDLGMQVTAADVSEKFLDLVRARHGSSSLRTLPINGRDLSNIPDGSLDLVAIYSVLHHIPDYLATVREMARVCKPGGVVVIDHEPAEAYWSGDPIFRQFQKEALKTDWRKFLRPANYWHRLRRVFDPRHSSEGDIHVWPDDHVEWPRIEEAMAQSGFDIVAEDVFLLCRTLYLREVFDRYVGRCADMKSMIFRKRQSPAI